MNAVVAIWSSMAAVCLVLALIHGHAWARLPARRADGAFALVAASVTATALLELALMHATSTTQYATLLRLLYVPLQTGVVGLVLFSWWYFGVRQRWLGWLVICGRAVVTAIGIASPHGVHFAELHAMKPVWLLGAPIVAPSGTPNPWFPIASVSSLLLVAFHLNTVWAAWRLRTKQRAAITLAVSLAVFVLLASLSGAAMVWGSAPAPITVTIFFTPIVVMIGLRLSQDLVRSARLSLELAEAGRRLEASQRKLLLAAEAAKAGFWSLDVADLRIWATPLALRLNRLPHDRPNVLDDLLTAIHPEDRESVERTLKAAAQGAPLVAVDYRVVDERGQTRWLTSFGGGLIEHGPRRLLTGMTQDVTERRRAQLALEQQRQDLEHLSRVATIGELSGALVHELNQPLSIIMANAETAQKLLEADAPDWDELRAIALDIVDADERAGQVVSRLRALLRRQAPELEAVDLNAVVGSVLRLLNSDLMQRGVRVQQVLGRELPALSAQRVSLEQLLINLVLNACDAVADRPVGQRLVEIRTAASAQGLLLEVLDRGPGLPDPPERVFEPFHTTKPGRLGMGLPVSRSIARAHGGTLQAIGRPGGGACLRLLLPIEQEETKHE